MKAKVSQLVKQADVKEARGEADTIRLWESYREQAGMWRAISLLQIPVTCLALIFSLFMWWNREIILKVPAKPLPGMHQAQEIPDSEFIDAATNFVNLVATYTPLVARRQLTRAGELVINPLLERYPRDYMINELKTIENTSRSQVFFADPLRTTVERARNIVEVSLTGTRMKVVAGKELDPVETTFTVQMTTIPRTDMNPYGIVIRDIRFENKNQDLDDRRG